VTLPVIYQITVSVRWLATSSRASSSSIHDENRRFSYVKSQFRFNFRQNCYFNLDLKNCYYSHIILQYPHVLQTEYTDIILYTAILNSSAPEHSVVKQSQHAAVPYKHRNISSCLVPQKSQLVLVYLYHL